VKKQNAEKLKKFTSKHLPVILKNSPSLIWQAPDSSLMVGRIRIYKNKESYYIKLPGDRICSFYKQRHAVCYASHYQTANLTRCVEIKLLDEKLKNYTTDIALYKQRLTKYLKENNEEKFHLNYARYTNLLPIKKRVEQECKKTIILAKYN